MRWQLCRIRIVRAPDPPDSGPAQNCALSAISQWGETMSTFREGIERSFWSGLVGTTLAVGLATATPVFAQAPTQKPNILVIMGDDIGMWNIGAYHRGLMAGRTPNLDRIAAEGMLFTDYYAEASCTAG